MVRRNFKKLNNDFLLIYKTYIRPHLEYYVQAWSPHLSKDIQCLESIQKAATDLVPGLQRFSYTSRIQKLVSPHAHYRKEGLIEAYKIMSGREHTGYRKRTVFPVGRQ